MDQEYSPFSFRGTSTSRDAPNPLRPYYIPPSIGLPPDQPPGPNRSTGAQRLPHSSRSNFPAAARELFNDLDYESYIPERDGNSIADMTKRLMDQAIWNYTSVLLAQPFEVAKIVLQCRQVDARPIRAASGVEGKSAVQTPTRSGGFTDERGYFDSEEESDSDAPSYFSPTTPYETPSSPSRHRRRKPPSRSLSATPTPSTSSRASSSFHSLELRKNDSLLEVLSQLWSKEGAWGVWKATNSTFVYNVLLKTIETWTRSLLSAMFNLPDASLLSLGSSMPGSVNILDSTNPIASIAIAVGAAGLAGLVLAPIDMIRTRLILTPVSSNPRALLPSLKALPSFICPPSLVPITFLHASLPTFLSTSVPLFFRSSLHIDTTTQTTFSSLTSFALSLTELFTKLPLETVLRRGHMTYLTTANTRQRMTLLPSADNPLRDMKTIVPVGPYKGVMGTMWFIVREEGQRVPVSAQVAASLGAKGELRRQPPRKGQGVAGLWRGWRVGFWGLVGMWAAGAVGGGSGDGQF